MAGDGLRAVNTSEVVNDKTKLSGGIACIFGRIEYTSLKTELMFLASYWEAVVKDFFVDMHRELDAYFSSRGHSSQSEIRDLLSFFESKIRKDEQISDSFLVEPTAAWPIEVLFLVLHFLVQCHIGIKISSTEEYKGYDDVLRESGKYGLIVAGKGVLAGLAVSMAKHREDLPRTTAAMFVAAFDVGLCYMKMLKQLYPEHVSKTFSLLIVGVRTLTLSYFMSEINKGLRVNGQFFDPRSILEFSTIFSNCACIVTGHPADISCLMLLLKTFREKKHIRIKMSEIQRSLHQNSNTMNVSIFFDLIKEWRMEGVHLDTKELHTALFSPVTGERWDAERSCDSFADFQQEVAFSLTRGNQDLRYSFQVLEREKWDIRRVVSIGSFGSSSLSIKDVLHWALFPLSSTRHQYLFTPKRASTSFCIRNTFQKLGVINDLWNEFFPESKKMLLLDSDLQRESSSDDKDDQGSRRCDPESISADVLSHISRNEGTPDSNEKCCVMDPQFVYNIRKIIPVSSLILENVQDVLSLLELWDGVDLIRETFSDNEEKFIDNKCEEAKNV